MSGHPARLVAALVALALGSAAPASGLTVEDLVNQVSQANIEAHVAALEGPRNTATPLADAADYIAGQLEGFGYTVTSVPLYGTENLVAELGGSASPTPVFIVGAHFDTVASSPGADDDASGVAGMLEAARVLSAGQYEGSIRFVAFTLEESGLIGSAYLAQLYQLAGDDVVGMISLEMIGYTCGSGCQIPLYSSLPCLVVGTEGVNVGDFIAAVANDASSFLASDFLLAAATYVPGLATNSGIVAGNGACFPDSRRSDHASFWDAGFPAMMLTDTANYRNPNYHAATDALATLDLGFAADVTRAVVAQTATTAVLLPEPRGTLMLACGVALLPLLARRRAARADAGTPSER